MPAPGATENSFVVIAESAEVGKFRLAPFRVALRTRTDSVHIGLGADILEQCAVRCGWTNRSDADELYLTVGPLPLKALGEFASVTTLAPELGAVTMSGGVVALIASDEQKPLQGRFVLELMGFTPPHPPELDGFPFGSSTRVDVRFTASRTPSAVELARIAVTSGAFELVGNGLVRLSLPEDASIQARLRGQIPCAAIAGAVAGSKLGRTYGNWVHSHASQLVQGSVDVTVELDADVSAIEQAKLVKRIGVGCGLRPLTIGQVLNLGLPPLPDADTLRHLEQQMPRLGIHLPPLPSLKPPDWWHARHSDKFAE
jgi:hypothetical protein